MDVTTFLRVNINGKWTNLGIVADEKEITEHFHFVEDLLQQKQRANQSEKRWNELKKIGWKQFDIYAETDIVKAKAIEDFIKKMNELEDDNE